MLAVVLAGLFATVFAVAGARAETVHKPLFELGEIPVEGPHGEMVALPGPLLNMEGMTVNSGHLWVAEEVPLAGSRVDEFDALTGAFLAQPVEVEVKSASEPRSGFGLGYGVGIAVGHGTGEPSVYVAGETKGVSTLSLFDEAGTPQATWRGLATPGKSFGSVSGVAADNSTSPLDGSRGDVFVLAGTVVERLSPRSDR